MMGAGGFCAKQKKADAVQMLKVITIFMSPSGVIVGLLGAILARGPRMAQQDLEHPGTGRKTLPSLPTVFPHILWESNFLREALVGERLDGCEFEGKDAGPDGVRVISLVING